MRFVDLSVSLSVSLLSLSLLFLPYLSFYLSLLFFPPLSAVTKHSHAVKKTKSTKVYDQGSVSIGRLSRSYCLEQDSRTRGERHEEEANENTKLKRRGDENGHSRIITGFLALLLFGLQWL